MGELRSISCDGRAGRGSSLVMTRLETVIAELMMRELDPCDLGTGIEVIHEVEAIEIEMDCDLDEDSPHRWFDEEFARTIKLANETIGYATHRLLYESTPYERIEIA